MDDRKVFDDYEGYEDPAQGTIALTPGDICAVLVVTGALRGRVFYYDINSYKSDGVEHVARGPSVRRVANAHRVILDTLGESGDSRWLPVLLHSLNDSSSEIRAKAAVALEKLGDPMKAHR